MIVKRRWFNGLASVAILAGAVLIGAQPIDGVNAGSVAGDAPDDCSVATMAANYGIDIHAQTGKALPAGIDKALGQVQHLEPGAVVTEQALGRLSSTELPTIDGYSAVVLRLEGLAPRFLGGPQPPEGEASTGASRSELQVVCALAIFDAETGEFLVSMIDSVAVP